MFLEAEVRIQTSIWKMKERVGSAVRNFFTTEEGDTNFISIIIILVIVIALAALFRENIAGMVSKMWDSIKGDANKAVPGSGEKIKTEFK